ALADRVIKDDLKINRLRYELEEGITEQLSVGKGEDVRAQVGALYVLAELERMGDHAEGIAKVALMLGPRPALQLPGVVHDLGRRTLSMVVRTLDALGSRDANLARAICGE